MPRTHTTPPRYLFPIIFLFFIIVLPFPVEACDCPWPGSPSVELKKSRAVFLGRLLDVQKKDESFTHKDVHGKIYQANSTVFRYRFSAEKSWKGATGKSVTLSSFLSDCMWPFEQSRLYLVYARKGEFDLETNLCTRTREAHNIEIENRFLDAAVRKKSEQEIFNDILEMARTDPHTKLRLEALDFLDRSLPDALPPHYAAKVIRVFQDKSQRVRARAASLLGYIRYHNNPKIKTALIRLLKDEWYTVRIAAAEALRVVTPEGDEPVLTALNTALKMEKIKILKKTLLREPNRRVIRSFAKGIAKVGGREGKKNTFPYFLEDLSSTDADIRHEAVVHLGSFGKLAKEAVPRLIEIYKSETRNRKKIIGTVLRNIGTPEAKKALAQLN